MCKNCDIVRAVFDAASMDAQKNFHPTLRFLEAMEKDRRISLYAGDCKLCETLNILSAEQHFTVCHYLNCTDCGQTFFLGSCIRGAPVYKLIDDIEAEDIPKRIWGNSGTRFYD